MTGTPNPGFHAHSGWFFRRNDDGSVTVAAPDSLGPGAHQTAVFDPGTWASIVAFVSAGGDTGLTHRAAADLHNNTPAPPTAGDRPFADLSATGLLWMINRALLHPRGFALAITVDKITGQATGWQILGHGDEPWTFGSGTEEATHFRNLARLLAAADARPTADATH